MNLRGIQPYAFHLGKEEGRERQQPTPNGHQRHTLCSRAAHTAVLIKDTHCAVTLHTQLCSDSLATIGSGWEGRRP